MNDAPCLTLILGGVRSGKSLRAERLAAAAGSRVLYIATAEIRPGEGSMADRIRSHRARRPASWRTFECPRRVAASLAGTELLRRADAVLLDCITLLVSNHLDALPEPTADALDAVLAEEIDGLVALAAESGRPWYVVSSETGLGVVAPDFLTRLYTDALGSVNQRLAAAAGVVEVVVAGVPLAWKGDSGGRFHRGIICR